MGEGAVEVKEQSARGWQTAVWSWLPVEMRNGLDVKVEAAQGLQREEEATLPQKQMLKAKQDAGSIWKTNCLAG